MKVIWTNDLDYDDWKEDLESEYPDEEGYGEPERIEIMYEQNNDDLNSIMRSLEADAGNSIIQFADLGLWNGRKTGYRYVKGTRYSDVFSYSVGDYTTWYVDGEEFKCKDVHHDGINYYTYRVLSKSIDEYEFDEYAASHSSREAMAKYTIPIGVRVGKLLGWYDE